MSEQASDKKEQEEGVDLSRRKLAKVGVVAPVIMTLASKPVFGAQCLSQMMSGNMSQAGDGSCRAGESFSHWKEPASESDWISALGLLADGTSPYGELTEGVAVENASCSDYVGGALFGDYFPEVTGEKEMRMLLCEDGQSVKSVYGGGDDAQIRNWIAAYLNARLWTNYILTPEQVLCFWDGTQSLPPGFTNLDAFFESTYFL